VKRKEFPMSPTVYPVSFVSGYAKNVSMASHIVLFDSEEQNLKNLLISFNYGEVID